MSTSFEVNTTLSDLLFAKTTITVNDDTGQTEIKKIYGVCEMNEFRTPDKDPQMTVSITPTKISIFSLHIETHSAKRVFQCYLYIHDDPPHNERTNISNMEILDTYDLGSECYFETEDSEASFCDKYRWFVKNNHGKYSVLILEENSPDIYTTHHVFSSDELGVWESCLGQAKSVYDILHATLRSLNLRTEGNLLVVEFPAS